VHDFHNKYTTVNECVASQAAMLREQSYNRILKSIPKLTAPTCVAVSPMLIEETKSTRKLMINCQLSTPGGLVSLMLPE